MLRKAILLTFILGTFTLRAQSPATLAANEGIWEGPSILLRIYSQVRVFASFSPEENDIL